MDKIIELLKQGSFSVPKIFLNKYRDLELNEKEFIILIYLMNYNGSFNPKQIALETGFDSKEVFEIISNLCDKGIIEIVIKSENKLKEEVISLDKLYNKLAFLVLNNEKKEEPKNLFSTFEKEFKRTLSPIEYEYIHAWKDNKFSEEIILAALKEAVLNGVTNLRYIDKILYEWERKGIKTPQDIENKRNNNQTKKVEVFDYDWLNED